MVEKKEMLNHRQKYDYTDIDPWELKLIRVGQAVWTILRREKRLKRLTVSEERALYAAIDILVELKKQKRAELKTLRADRAQKTRDHFAKKAVA